MRGFRRLSAPGSSALSIWELRGLRSDLEEIFGSSLPTAESPLRLDRNSLPFDEALLWHRQGSEGETDGMILECHLHGGHGVASAFRSWLQGCGWVEGALQQVGSRDLLIHANSPLAARVALPLADGGFGRTLADIQALDGSDRKTALENLARWNAWAEVLATPPTLLLAGPANSGKSSLFNLWNEAELVTTHEGAGTTRDLVQARILLGTEEEKAMFHLVDSAGIGDGLETLDRQAMALTLQGLPTAWCVLWLLDNANPPGPVVLDQIQKRRPFDLVILHRTDLEPAWSPGEVGIKPDLEGNIKEGRAWIHRIEARILKSLGPAPPPGAVVALEEEQRRQIEKLLRDLD